MKLRSFPATFGRVALLAGAFILSASGPSQATKIERVISPGGIEAWLVREAAVPLIAIDFAFRGGSSQDPAEKPGVAYMTAALLDKGAGALVDDAFQQRVADLAMELNFSANRDTLQGSVRLLGEHRDEGLELVRMALTAPRFDAEPIERTRAQVLASLRRETTNPSLLANRIWWRTAFPKHPYGQPHNGTPESIPTIVADDMRGYLGRVLARDTLKVAVVGDIDPATLSRLLDRMFGDLPAKADLVAVPPAELAAPGRRLVIDFDAPQTVLNLGGTGIARKDPDFIPAFVVNHILGGGSFSSRLYHEIREKRGLAYGVYSYLLPLDHAALFMSATQTRSERAGEALDIIEAEVRRMASEGPTQEELDRAKTYLKGSYALRFDTSTRIASQLLAIQLEELGIDYIDRRNDLIDAVTIGDARRAAKRLAEGGLFVAAVGRPKGITGTSPSN